MGLRTLWMETARRARIEGYLPICPEALERWPVLREHCAARHLCVLIRGEPGRAQRAAAAGLLARAAQRGARPHLCLVAVRAECRAEGAIEMDPMGRSAMTTMIYVDPDYGPSEADILDAVRAAEGAPGRFVSYLSRAENDAAAGFTVHETPAVYISDTAAKTDATVPHPSPVRNEPTNLQPARRSRIGSVLWRARSRASALHARGRHAAAARLLIRAARALEARGEVAEAARCCLQLGWAARSRGALSAAHQGANEAARIDPSADCQITAGLLEAVCRTDERRFSDADAALRSLVVSASTLGCATIEQHCRLALVRALCWQARWTEADDMLGQLGEPSEALVACGSLLLRSRILRESRDIAGALRSARDALRQAEAVAEPRLVAGARRAAAESLSIAGEIEQVGLEVRHGLEAACAARLPLPILRLRAVMLTALLVADRPAPEEPRLRAVLERAAARGLPPLIEHEVRKALDTPELQKRFAELGGDIRPMSPAELMAYVRAEHAKWAGVVKVSGARIE